jgi:hypothetical protein
LRGHYGLFGINASLFGHCAAPESGIRGLPRRQPRVQRFAPMDGIGFGTTN